MIVKYFGIIVADVEKTIYYDELGKVLELEPLIGGIPNITITTYETIHGFQSDIDKLEKQTTYKVKKIDNDSWLQDVINLYKEFSRIANSNDTFSANRIFENMLIHLRIIKSKSPYYQYFIGDSIKNRLMQIQRNKIALGAVIEKVLASLQQLSDEKF
ncbi:hypothetical protein D3C81_1248040 [compost metagenome]